MTRPMPAVRPVRSCRALSLRRNPSSSMACCTSAAVPGSTPGSPLTTRETVLRPTPARAATSFMVGRGACTGEPSAARRPRPGPLAGDGELAPGYIAAPSVNGPGRPPPRAGRRGRVRTSQVYGFATGSGGAQGSVLCVRGGFPRWIHRNFHRPPGRKLPPSCRSQLPPAASPARFALFMWGSMVVLIPRTGVTREATAALARALGGVRLVVVERSLSADTDWRHAVLDQRSAAAEAEAIERQLAAAPPADEVVVVG